MNNDGSDPQPLTEGSWDDIDPTWSPDGQQIAFASNRDGSRQLYIMQADGGEPRRVTQGVSQIGGRNDWSPDGQKLAFYAGPRGDRDIYVVDIHDQSIDKLTDGGDNLAPSYSPDGQWITFTSYRDGNNEIYIMRLDGSEIIRLTFDSRSDWQPRWGP
jgi:Tol biopolymer transport system component